MGKINDTEIDILLQRAFSSEDPEEIDKIARQVLQSDPDNPEAMVLIADNAQDEDERIRILQKALDIVRSSLPDTEQIDGQSLFYDENEGILYIAILQRLAFSFFSAGDVRQSFDMARELIDIDPDDQTFGKTLYYRCLLEMEDYDSVLRFTEQDQVQSPARSHAKAIALFSMQGPSEEAREALWDLFSVGPDIPFYLIGYWGEPDDEYSQESEDFNFSLLFEDAWNKTEALLRWLTKATVVFGYVTERLNPDILDNMESLMEDLAINAPVPDQIRYVRNEVSEVDEVEDNERDLRAIDLLRDLSL
ncbi:MAG TPA: hypothetical protein PLV56_00905 [Synergistales bacterium]|nr:hypothetical protein [Synergistales bacterium]